MAFSATEAAFEGFRLVRRNPLVLVFWSLLYLIVIFAQLLMVRSMGDALARMEAAAEQLENGPPPSSLADFQPMFQAYGELMGGLVGLFPLALVISAVIAAAVARGVLEPEKKSFGYLRLGMDELRVLGVTVVLAVLMIAVGTVAGLIGGVVGGIAVAMLEGWGVLIMVLLFIGLACLFIWLAVRFSLAVPMTVDEKRFALFDSFRVTKGRFWPLLGMALLAFLMMLVVQLLAGIVAMPVNMMAGIGALQGMGGDPMAMLKSFDVTNPWMVAAGVLGAVIQALCVGILTAPFAAAYRDLRAG